MINLGGPVGAANTFLYKWQCLVKMWVCSYPRIDFFLQTHWIRGILSWVFKIFNWAHMSNLEDLNTLLLLDHGF